MKIDAQIVAVRAAQGILGIERSMLSEAFVGPPAPTSSPGVNATKRLALSDGATVFHKPFSGVNVVNALAFGQTDETPPLHDAVAWRVAVALGEPWQSLVSPCVLREHDGDDGALSLQASGWPGDLAPTLNPTWCSSAAFFDSLIAQQDRHAGNWRWDGSRLTLIDHGYAFARPGDILNHTDLLVARRDHGAAALLDARASGAGASARRTPACSGSRACCCPIARRRSGRAPSGCSRGVRFYAPESSKKASNVSSEGGSMITQEVNLNGRWCRGAFAMIRVRFTTSEFNLETQ